jgi:DNA invertase Pin-like site-specific DNA recombinase
MPLFRIRPRVDEDQDLAQDAELMRGGCAKVFKEKASGAKTDRPEVAKAIRQLEPGEVLGGQALCLVACARP